MTSNFTLTLWRGLTLYETPEFTPTLYKETPDFTLTLYETPDFTLTLWGIYTHPVNDT